jgi:hypothetical protein
MRPYAKHIGVLRYDGWTIRELYQGPGDQPDEALMVVIRELMKRELEATDGGKIQNGFFVIHVTERRHYLMLVFYYEDSVNYVLTTAKNASTADFKSWAEYPDFFTSDLITLGIEAALWQAHCKDGALDIEAWANAPHAPVA